MNITEEMINHFCTRLLHHQNLVIKYYQKIFPNICLLEHDESKYEDVEFEPYVLITWNYKLKREGLPLLSLSKDELQLCNEATEHHILHNKHHPEYWSTTKTNLISKTDRDKPNGNLIEIPYMSEKYLIEMCADWCAVSEERNTSPIDWANNNLNVRWKFSIQQTKDIYQILDILWNNYN